MSDFDALKLTLDAIYLTFTGDAPITIWSGLFIDIINNIMGWFIW